MNYFEPIELKRRGQKFLPDSSRVITRFFGPGGRKRQKRIIQRMVSLPTEKTREILQAVLRDFSDRQQDLENTLLRHSQWFRRHSLCGVGYDLRHCNC